MSIITVLLLAVALGADAFSVCLGLGMAGIRRKQMFVVSTTIFVFHVLMPLAGWYVGKLAGNLVGQAASAIGAMILIFLGIKMLWETYKGSAKDSKAASLNNWGLIVLAVSVSLDALSVGFTLGTHQFNLILTTITFGIVAGLLSFSGLCMGRILGSWVGERAHLIGGVILIGIGIKLLI